VLSIRTAVSQAELRPRPISLKEGSDARDRWVAAMADDAYMAAKMEMARGAAAAAGTSAIAPIVTMLRAEGERIAEAEVTRRRKAGEASLGSKVPDTPRKRDRQWAARLTEALALRDRGIDPHEVDPHGHGGLFHRLGGLRKYLMQDGRRRAAEDVWADVIGRCRREKSRAARAQAAKQRAQDAAVYEASRRMAATAEHAAVRMQRAWRAIRDERASNAVAAVWRGDQAPKATMTVAEGEALLRRVRKATELTHNYKGTFAPCAAPAWTITWGWTKGSALGTLVVSEIGGGTYHSIGQVENWLQGLRRRNSATAARRAQVHDTDDDFLPELGKIGQKFVDGMADTPCCLPAFEAWFHCFFEKFETIAGRDGLPFKLEKELTYEVYLEALHRMPRGKAVGAGGFSAEMLRLAGDDVKRAFYDALMDDVRGKCLAPTWRRVLYVLLEKPKPNNPEVIAERREIALMAQEMKLLLQMVRSVAYQRVVSRVLCNQAGWLSGFGCTDPALVVAGLIQQQRRLQQPLWILFIDLSTFFPRLDRRAVRVAELWHGLPREVRELSALIYGAGVDGSDAVVCQYDSAAGLGDGFQNHMGALMGCVLSPDKAKLFLNSILVAISLVCKGVALRGYGTADVEETWTRIAQVAFADDWCGCFGAENELRKAWEVWRVWTLVSGSKLGVKLRLKTAVTGVCYVDGKPTSVPDPRLPLRDGYVPFIPHDEAYKHLGIPRTVGGSDDAAWRKVSGAFHAALARIRQLHKPTVHEFFLVSNALLGGLAGYYLQTLYITWQQAETIERKWRAIYRQKFGRSLRVSESTPRTFYYAERAGGSTRRHIWTVGLAALLSCINNAAADVAATPQRAAARSMIAAALERWGCRSDPGRWSWDHCADALESQLRRSKCRELGEAWMLATCLLERRYDEWWEAREPMCSEWERDFVSEMRAQHGRWIGDIEVGDPLHPGAAHFAATRERSLFEPSAQAGLGIAIEPLLLEAGVVSAGHMTRQVGSDDSGAPVYEWMSYKSARRRNHRLQQRGVVEKAWERTIGALRSAGVAPPPEETVGAGEGGRLKSTLPIARSLRSTAPAGTTEQTVSFEETEGIVRLLERRDEAGQEEVRALTMQQWRRKFKRAFPAHSPRPATEWAHGGRDRAAEARGAHFVEILTEDRSERRRGGEARWLRRHAVSEGNFGDMPIVGAVSATGEVVGWEAEAARLHSIAAVDDEGFIIDPATRARYIGAELGALPPAIQAMARARIRIDEITEGEVRVVDEEIPTKRKATHVNVAVQRRNLGELIDLQARFGVTSVHTHDGSRDIYKVEGSAWEYVITRACASHDGVERKGRLHEPEGADNYIAELAALLDTAWHLEKGGRVVLIFDATSPPQAAARFRRVCDRWKQGYYVGEWLDLLLRLLDRQEVVVLVWQTSHVGSALNEWADVLAAEAKELGRVPVPRAPASFSSLQPTAFRRSTMEGASRMAMREVRSRLDSAVHESEVRAENDLDPVEVSEEVWSVCHAVLGQRAQVGDAKRQRGAIRGKALAGLACPFGCKRRDGSPAAFTWLHVQCSCAHPPLVQLRRAWRDTVLELEDALDTKDPNVQLIALRQIIGKGLPQLRGGEVAPEAPLSVRQEQLARRATGGLVLRSGHKDGWSRASTRKALRQTTEAGAALQLEARRLTMHLEEEIIADIKKARRVRKLALTWLRVTVEGGPARAAALRRLHAAKAVAQLRVEDEERDGFLSAQATDAALDEIRRRVATAGRAARTLYPHRGAHAYGDWHIARLAAMWRLRAALQGRREGGRSAGLLQRTQPEILATALLRQVLTPRAEAVAQGVEATDGLPVAVVVPTRAPLTVQIAQAAMRVSSALRLREADGAHLMSLIESEQRAHRAWDYGGGAEGEARRQRENARDARDRTARQQARQFDAYFAQDVTGSVGLSGEALTGVGACFTVEIAPRGRRRRRRREDSESQLRRTAARNRRAAVDDGAAADQWGRWQVEQVLQVRRVHGSGRERHLEALIRWKGVVLIGQHAGLPWPDDWMRVTLVDVHDAETGRFDGAMTRELYSECRAVERQRYGTGTRTARAPTEERSGAPTSSRLPTRWTGRLRRAREGADDGDSGGRASRQRREVGEEAADERAALGAEAAGGSTDDEEDPTRQLFDGPGDDGLGARGQKRAREPDELADLLEETDRRKAREAEMRARVAAEMAARMDTGIRVNAELAEWAGVPRRLKRAEESPPEGEPSAKRRETP
jgi:ribonuclease HI